MYAVFDVEAFFVGYLRLFAAHSRMQCFDRRFIDGERLPNDLINRTINTLHILIDIADLPSQSFLLLHRFSILALCSLKVAAAELTDRL